MSPYKVFCLILFTITLVAFFIYGTSQQILRALANDPQIQIAGDAAQKLNGNTTIESFTKTDESAIGETLSPYLLVTNEDGRIIAGSATLNGVTPIIPIGALRHSDDTGENIITWQPQAGIREALVVRPFKNKNSRGYVIAGRSLRETEKRITRLGYQVMCGWLVSLSLILLFFIASYYFDRLWTKN